MSIFQSISNVLMDTTHLLVLLISVLAKVYFIKCLLLNVISAYLHLIKYQIFDIYFTKRTAYLLIT